VGVWHLGVVTLTTLMHYSFIIMTVILAFISLLINTHPHTGYQPSSTINLAPNDFPYYFPPNVDHLILWCTRPFTQPEIDAALPSLLAARYGGAQIEVQQFVNPSVLQSIKEIFHAHIIVLRS
jgi:hypothetical protein